MGDAAKLISVCLAVRDQASLLPQSLNSIFRQQLPDGYEMEVIATDDGSTDDTAAVLKRYPLTYFHLDNYEYHNGVFAKNSSMRNARGDILIQQSAEVIHSTPDLIFNLLRPLPTFRATFATVHNKHMDTGKVDAFQYTGLQNKRPFFFLGACYREDVCKIGGYDPALGHVVYFDDNWHADCLLNTCRVKPKFLPECVGWHQDHSRPIYDTFPAKTIYGRLKLEAMQGVRPYVSSAGVWPYSPGKSVEDILSCAQQ
jgi:glycosyltransferase involved in cell wall biosynthesis